MRISDWSSDVCSSDLGSGSGQSFGADLAPAKLPTHQAEPADHHQPCLRLRHAGNAHIALGVEVGSFRTQALILHREGRETIGEDLPIGRSEEHTSELQSLMRISYAVFCLKKKKPNKKNY